MNAYIGLYDADLIEEIIEKIIGADLRLRKTGTHGEMIISVDDDQPNEIWVPLFGAAEHLQAFLEYCQGARR